MVIGETIVIRKSTANSASRNGTISSATNYMQTLAMGEPVK